jgi:hypothetical protein
VRKNVISCGFAACDGKGLKLTPCDKGNECDPERVDQCDEKVTGM